MSIFVKIDQKKSLSILMDSTENINWDLIINWFKLLNIDICSIYSVAIEIESKKLFDFGLNNKVEPNINPALYAIKYNNDVFYEYSQNAFPLDEIVAFTFAIEISSSLINKFVNKLPITLTQCMLAIRNCNNMELFTKLFDKIYIEDGDTSKIINYAVEYGSLAKLIILKNLNFKITKQSLTIAVRHSTCDVVEFILQSVSINEKSIIIPVMHASQETKLILDFYGVKMQN